MKIFIEKRALKADGTRSLRLVYDHGYATNTLGGRQNKRQRSYETLDLYVHDKPKTPTQRQSTISMITSFDITTTLGRIITMAD